jgi:tetratricopeptide (TPR) repeat protein
MAPKCQRADINGFNDDSSYQLGDKWEKIRPPLPAQPIPALAMKPLVSTLLVVLLPLLLGAVGPTPSHQEWAATEVQFRPTGMLAVLPERDLPHPYSVTIERAARRLPDEEMRHARAAIDQAVVPRPGCGRRPGLSESLSRLLPPDEALLAQGLYHFDAGRFREATAIFHRVIAAYPLGQQVPAARYWLAECALATGHRERAIGQFQGLLDEWPGHPLAAYASYSLAWLAMEQGDLASAAKQLNRGLAGPPTDLTPSLHLWRLAIALAGDDLDTARSTADAILASGPQAWQASVRQILGEVLFHLGRYQEARDLLADSDTPVSRLTVAWCRLRLGDLQGAVTTFDELQRQAADPIVALGATVGLFDTALTTGDLAAAESLLDVPPLRDGGDQLLSARLALAQAQLKAGHVEEAMTGFQSILAAAPSSPHASRTRLALARALFAAKEYTDAAETLRYLTGQPGGLTREEDAEAHFLLARSLHLLSELGEAEKYYRELREQRGDTSWARRARFYEGFLYLGQRRLLEAIPLLEQVPADDPNWTVAMQELGKAYLTLGNTARAQAIFARVATDARPAARGDALFLLAETAFENGDLTAAYDYYRQVTETHPDADRLRRCLMRMAQVLTERGDYRGSTTLLKSVAARFPDHPVAEEALLAIGVNELRDGRRDGAIAAFSRFTQRFPDSPHLGEALYRLGTAYRQDGQSEQAAHAFGQAAAAGGEGPSAIAASWAAAFSLADLGRANAAIEAMTALFRDHGANPQSLLDSVEWLRSTGNADYAAHALNEMEARLDSTHWRAQVELTRGLMQEKGEAPQEAIASYAKLLRSYPAESAARVARLRMAHLYVDTQEYFLASQVLRRILDDPTDTEHQGEARLLLGQVYESLNFSDRALETYLPLVESHIDQRYHGQAAFRIGRLLLELGQAERAYPFFVEAGNDTDLSLVELLPYYRGRTLVEMGQSGEGIRQLESYLNGLPADPLLEIQAYLSIAKGYLQQGDRAAALRVLARANTLAEGTPFADTVRALRMQLVDTAVDQAPLPTGTTTPASPIGEHGFPPPADDTPPRAPAPADP